MQIIEDIAAMRAWAGAVRARGRRIGLVPTMGYLHAGHLSLVGLARSRADTVVASIFVNPTQFGPSEDLAAYPRDLDHDTTLLDAAGVDVLFLPTAAAMYPAGHQTAVTVSEVTRGLCGTARPVHFQGVATIVTKLFNIVTPDVAVFGRKDFQQLVTIRRLVADLDFNVDVVGASIVREADGLAMSSRNAYLGAAERTAACALSQALGIARDLVGAGETSGDTILAAVRAHIAAEPLAALDYATLVHPETLLEVETLDGPTLLALAVQIGKARLIDNEVLCEEKTWPATAAAATA